MRVLGEGKPNEMESRVLARVSTGRWRLVAVTTGLALTAGCGGSAISGDSGEASKDGPVKIGVTTALTGPYSEFGVPMENSIEIAIDEFNKAGRCDQEVRLVSYDDQLVAETAQSNMRRLLEEDQVDFVIAPAGSGPTLAVLPLVNAANKLMMNTVAQTSTIVTPEGEDQPYPNVFSTSLGNMAESEFMGNFVNENYGSVGLLGESTPYGDTGLDEIERVLEEGGTQVVGREQYDQGATDVTAQLARLRKGNPDAIALIGLANDATTIRQTMARLDMLDLPFIISNGAGTVPYQERAGELADGTIVVHYKAFAGGEPDNDAARSYAEQYREEFGNDLYYGDGEWPVPAFGGGPAGAYDATKVLLDAFETAGCTVDTDEVAAEMESGTSFEVSRGEYAFSEEDHDAVTPELLTMNQYVVSGDGNVSFEPAEQG